MIREPDIFVLPPEEVPKAKGAIDPERKEVIAHRLAEGSYRVERVTTEILRSSAVPGLWLKLEWLFREPLLTDHRLAVICTLWERVRGLSEIKNQAATYSP